MTWPIASLAVLLLALGAGIAWWERSRPPARVLALVAALAALAALGRLAFAAVPNVKPTTDIVLLAGYVLGGAPGFAVGAVAALASNVVFGEGPWTPWQMAAWGLVGILGAGLGGLTGRRLRRIPLAAACGIAGLLFGAIMDLSSWTTVTGTHTLASYGTISAVSLPFNVAHAVGNVAFCLLFGPALVAALQRFAVRAHVVWRPAGAVVPALAVAAVLGGALSAPPRADAATPASRALGYLRAAQNADGGLGTARGVASSPEMSSWSAIGVAAAGRSCGRPLTAYLRRTGARVHGVADVERTLLALRACGSSPRIGSRDLLADLRRAQHAGGDWGGLVNQTAFGVLALRAAGVPASSPALARAVGAIIARQGADGGFSYLGPRSASGVDDTASALQALVAAGAGGTRATRRATAWLRRAQRPDGGFAVTAGGTSNAQSTAFAVQGLIAAGVRPSAIRRGGSRTATAYLASLLTASGAVRYSRTSAQTPVWVTAQALAALAGRPLPVLG